MDMLLTGPCVLH